MLSAARCDTDGNMAADSKPSRQEQPSPAAESAPPAAPPNTQPVTVHHLIAKDYWLGKPESAQLPLKQEHKLKARNYVLKRPGTRHMTAGDQAEMIAEMERWLLVKQAETCTTIFQRTPATIKFAHELARQRGIKAS